MASKNNKEMMMYRIADTLLCLVCFIFLLWVTIGSTCGVGVMVGVLTLAQDAGAWILFLILGIPLIICVLLFIRHIILEISKSIWK